ncbi:MAG: UPF0182 family protein, partial [Chloroflexia bacterium]
MSKNDKDELRNRRIPPDNTAKKTVTNATPAKRGRGCGWVAWVIGLVLFLFILIPSLSAEAITDWMWFGSQGLADVYTTRLWLSLGVFAGGFILSMVFLLANWLVALRGIQAGKLYEGQQEVVPKRAARWVAIAAAVAVAFFMGLGAAEEWPNILLYLKGGAFGQTDPLFGNDIGFYVFEMPFYLLLRGWLMTALILGAIGTGIVYLIGNGPQLARQFASQIPTGPGNRPTPINVRDLSLRLPKTASVHLTILGAIFLALVGVGYWFDRFNLLYGSHDVAFGANYTDANARVPALNIMMFIAAAMVVLLIVNLWVRTWKLLAGAIGLWLLALVLVAGVYPAIIQQFVVSPAQSQLETPYIENNIKATRAAFGLDKFNEREVPAVDSITRAQIDENPNITNNIRLWDYRPLLDTYGKLQEIRSYYALQDVDIDRYQLNGTQRQVMLAARELSSDELGANIRTWENLHFRYTHGYGIAMSTVNDIEGEGLPHFVIKDIPPVSSAPDLAITRPEIYFGEETNEYAFVNSSEIEEFDYPVGDTNKFTRYQGTGGVAISDFFTKLLFAVRFGDGNVMISPYVTDGARVLYHRNIKDIVHQLAPFLTYEDDPYMVVTNGKLYWVEDAHTSTDKYPYSTPYGGEGGLNYIRNSVKVVIDAYEGTATFYVIDNTDPLINAYRQIFPSLFKDGSEMPTGIREHLRYPEGLMNIQARMFATFHMTDPQVFYTKEDVWSLPADTSSSSGVSNVVIPEAYYVNIQLPGEAKVDFMLIQSFTPNTKDNMIAWMAAKSDPADYGQVEVIKYPKQQLVYGPKQIEARIDQDPVISQQLSLWNGSGSEVIRGNLLTIPISNTLLYIEPLFLQATNSGSFPELKRVIVATGNSVGIGSDLAEALDVAFKLKPPVVIPGTDTGTPTPTPVAGATSLPTQPRPTPNGTATGRTAEEITQSALDHYNRAQDALKRSDWATYGEEIDAMKADLD